MTALHYAYTHICIRSREMWINICIVKFNSCKVKILNVLRDNVNQRKIFLLGVKRYFLMGERARAHTHTESICICCRVY